MTKASPAGFCITIGTITFSVYQFILYLSTVEKMMFKGMEKSTVSYFVVRKIHMTLCDAAVK